MNKPATVLIGGTGRSGTNLVKNLLLGHEHCRGLPFETRFVTDPDGTVPTLALLRHSWSPYTAAAAISRHVALLERVGTRSCADRIACRTKWIAALAGRRARLGRYAEWELERWFPDYWHAVERLQADLQCCEFSGRWVGAQRLYEPAGPRQIAVDDEHGVATTAFSAFLASLYVGFLAKEGGEVYVDDNTFNILYADWLHELLPQAVFVDVRRDPRDVVVSYREQGWAPDRLDHAATYCRTVLRRSRRAVASVPTGKVLTLTLDGMANEPDQAEEALCRTIGLDTDGVDVTRDPVRSASLGRWQRSLSKADAEWLTSYLEAEILEYEILSGRRTGS